MNRTLVSVFAVVLDLVALLPGLSPAAIAQQPANVYTDDMSSPALGLLSQTSPDPTQYSFEYRNGQFIAQAISRSYQGDIFSFVGTPELSDLTVAVDVGIGGADEREIYGFVGCRAGTDHEGYMFLVEPTTGRAALWREDAAGSVLLSETFVRHLVTPGVNQFNRLAIDCIGSNISGLVNGTVAVSAVDSTFTSGIPYIGIGNSGGAVDNLFGVFDNLRVTDFSTSTGPVTPAGGNVTFDQGIKYVIDNPPTAGPFSAAADLVDGDEKFMTADVVVTNFYAEVGFVMPVNPPPGYWAIGFCFWVDPQGNCYSAFVGTDGGSAQWFAVHNPATGSLQSIASGPLSNMDFAPGAVNYFGLLVSGNEAVVTMNSYGVAGSFSLPGQPLPGDVRLDISFSDDPDADSRPLHLETRDFMVWDLSGASASTVPGSTPGTPNTLVAGPLAGTIVEDAERVKVVSTGVSLSDFYTASNFTVPAASMVVWDITIGFRDSGDANEYRFSVRSDGEWRFSRGTGGPPIASGTVSNVLTTPGQVNTLEILVDGASGQATLNGVLIAQFDTSASLVAGDVWVGTAVFASTALPGRETQYSGFEVWSLA